MKEIALSLLPIVLFFGLFQIFALRLSGKTLAKILIGLVYTYIGLVLFLTGANVALCLPVITSVRSWQPDPTGGYWCRWEH